MMGFSQQNCIPNNPEVQGILPPPPMSQYCEDEEGHTIFYQFLNTVIGSYCDQTLVSNGTDPQGNVIDYSEMRLWDYMEALLDECARDTLCNGGFIHTGQQSVFWEWYEFYETPSTIKKIDIYGDPNPYTGAKLDAHFDWFRLTANMWKSNLPNPTNLCSGSYCGVWLIEDYELYDIVDQNGISLLQLEVEYKLACCPCEDDDNDFPPDLGNGKPE